MKVIPVITGDTVTISKSFIKHLNNLSGEHKIKELQKISHVGHCTHTVESKGEDKAISLQVWTGSSGSREMRLPEFLDIRHLKALRFSNLSPSYLYPKIYPYICVEGCVDPRAIVELSQ